MHGWGNWKEMSLHNIPTRDRRQIRGHAIKFRIYHAADYQRILQEANSLRGERVATSNDDDRSAGLSAGESAAELASSASLVRAPVAVGTNKMQSGMDRIASLIAASQLPAEDEITDGMRSHRAKRRRLVEEMGVGEWTREVDTRVAEERLDVDNPSVEGGRRRAARRPLTADVAIDSMYDRCVGDARARTMKAQTQGTGPRLFNRLLAKGRGCPKKESRKRGG